MASMLLFGDLIKDLVVIVFVLIVGAIIVSGGVSFLAGAEARASYSKFTQVVSGACKNGYAAKSGFKIPYGYMIMQTHPQVDTLKEDYERVPSSQGFWIFSVDKSKQIQEELTKLEKLQKCSANISPGTGTVKGGNCVCLVRVNTNAFADVLTWITSLGKEGSPTHNNFLYFFGGPTQILEGRQKALDIVKTQEYDFSPENNVFGIGGITYLLVNHVNSEENGIEHSTTRTYDQSYTALEEFSRATFLASAYSITSASWPLDVPFIQEVMECKTLAELECENQGAPAIIGVKNPSEPGKAFIPVLMGWGGGEAEEISATQNQEAYAPIPEEGRVFHPVFVKAVG